MPFIVVYNVQRLFPGRVGDRPCPRRYRRAGLDRDNLSTQTHRHRDHAGLTTGGARPAILIQDANAVADVCAAAGWPEMIDVDVPGEQMDGYDVAYDPATFAGHGDAQSLTAAVVQITSSKRR